MTMEQKEVLCPECGAAMIKHEETVAGDVLMANGQVQKVVSHGWYECRKCGHKKGYKDGYVPTHKP